VEPLDDKSLFALIDKGDQNDFEYFNDAIGDRISLARGRLVRTARSLARDLQGDEDVVEIAIHNAVESLHNQFKRAPVRFKFDPALAPFDEYLVLHLGGKDGIRGVIDTLRQRRRRARTDTIGEEEQLDLFAQMWASQGARWLTRGKTIPLPPVDFDAPIELETLTPRERFVLRMELSGGTIPSNDDLAELIRSCNFEIATQIAMLDRAQSMDARCSPQERCAQLLGLKSPRSVHRIKQTAINKLKVRYAPSTARRKRGAA